MFNDGVIKMGRVLVLFAFTSQMGQQYPTDAWTFWDIYHRHCFKLDVAVVLSLWGSYSVLECEVRCPCGAHTLYFNVKSVVVCVCCCPFGMENDR
jgi:hypothetical protein